MISKEQNKQSRFMGDTDRHKEYWAKADAKKCANFLHDYQYQWGDYYSGCTMQTTWLRNYLAYYLPAVHPAMVDTSLIPEGIQGEILRMYTPDMRVAIRQLVSIITKLRLNFSCVGIAEGSNVIDEIAMGNGLLDQIVQKERLDIKGPGCFEGSIVCGKWFLKTIWSTERGIPAGYDDNGRLIRSGGVEISNLSIFDYFYDIEFPDQEMRDWGMARVTRNRWHLIAEHPDLRTQLLALPATNERTNYNFFLGNRKFNYDNVDVYEFYYKPSPALPKGRMLIFCDPDCILYDGINKYECIPIEEMSPENILNTGMAYPKMTDLMGTQEMLDNTISAVATNSAAFAVQNVLMPRGANINVDEINGMRFVSYTPIPDAAGGGEPKPLNLSATAPETFKFIELLSDKIKSLSLLSGVLSGNPPPGVTSGTAIATLSASSIEAMSAFNLAYYYCMEKTMGHALNAFQKFGDIDQVVELEGTNAQKTMKSFNKAHIKNLSGVKITNTNPLMNLISGRIEIAEKLMGMPRDLWGDYCAILEGQPLRNLYRGEVSKTDLIELENEKLSQGINIPVLSTDNHAKHIQLHAAEISDPTVRMNAEYVETYLEHIMEHYKQAKETMPDLQYMVETGHIPPIAPGAPPVQQSGNPAVQPPAATEVAAMQHANTSIQPNKIAGGNNIGGEINDAEIAEPAHDLLRRMSR